MKSSNLDRSTIEIAYALVSFEGGSIRSLDRHHAVTGIS
jgi:hypothetical protein